MSKIQMRQGNYKKKAIFFLKKVTKNLQIQKFVVPLHRFRERNGRLAQLVQSICLTSRGSAVRIRQRPLQGERHVVLLFLFCHCRVRIAGYVLETLQNTVECMRGLYMC